MEAATKLYMWKPERVIRLLRSVLFRSVLFLNSRRTGVPTSPLYIVRWHSRQRTRDATTLCRAASATVLGASGETALSRLPWRTFSSHHSRTDEQMSAPLQPIARSKLDRSRQTCMCMCLCRPPETLRAGGLPSRLHTAYRPSVRPSCRMSCACTQGRHHVAHMQSSHRSQQQLQLMEGMRSRRRMKLRREAS